MILSEGLYRGLVCWRFLICALRRSRMLLAMAMPSILRAVMNGKLVEKSRRRAERAVGDSWSGQNFLGGVAVAIGGPNGLRRALLQIRCGLMAAYKPAVHSDYSCWVGELRWLVKTMSPASHCQMGPPVATRILYPTRWPAAGFSTPVTCVPTPAWPLRKAALSIVHVCCAIALHINSHRMGKVPGRKFIFCD